MRTYGLTLIDAKALGWLCSAQRVTRSGSCHRSTFAWDERELVETMIERLTRHDDAGAAMSVKSDRPNRHGSSAYRKIGAVLGRP